MPFTPPPVTTPGPATLESRCADIVNITDSSGALVKKACFIPLDMSPQDAQDYALSYGYTGLYTITNQNDLDSLSGLYYSGAEFIVNGYQGVDGNWVYFGSSQPMFPGAIPASGSDNCISIADNGAGGFVTITRSCEYENWFVVEIPGSNSVSTTGNIEFNKTILQSILISKNFQILLQPVLG